MKITWNLFLNMSRLTLNPGKRYGIYYYLIYFRQNLWRNYSLPPKFFTHPSQVYSHWDHITLPTLYRSDYPHKRNKMERWAQNKVHALQVLLLFISLPWRSGRSTIGVVFQNFCPINSPTRYPLESFCVWTSSSPKVIYFSYFKKNNSTEKHWTHPSFCYKIITCKVK